MRLIDEEHLNRPARGSRQMVDFLRDEGYVVNRKKVQRLMRQMGIEGLAPKPRTTRPNTQHRVYPYLLRDLDITRPNQVWCSDITYIPLHAGYLYLVAVMDWYSRYILSWRLSNTLDAEFCVAALDEALARGTPEVFNTDQGAQFTSREFIARLEAAAVAISMDGRGRALDNVMIERFWRTLKYEEVYLKEYRSGADCYQGLKAYVQYYGHQRRHQSLEHRTPWEVYHPSRSKRSRASL
jgi:putative transposase